MKKTEKLIYTNSNNESIELSWFSNLTPTVFNDQLDIEVNTTKNALQDGETYVSDTLQPRKIYINAFYQLNSASDNLERRIKRIFNPKLSGVLRFISSEERYIDVKLQSLPEITRKKGMATVSIDMLAYNPFWRTAERTEFLALLVPTLNFPQPFNVPITFGQRVAQIETIIRNIGDTETGFVVTLKARGEVTNPRITNNKTGAYIKVNYEMQKDDIIKLYNLPFNKQILVNGVKSFNRLDRLNSTFFNLDVGENKIGFEADINTTNLDVLLTYSPKYL